jgi:hypothetical protein
LQGSQTNEAGTPPVSSLSEKSNGSSQTLSSSSGSDSDEESEESDVENESSNDLSSVFDRNKPKLESLCLNDMAKQLIHCGLNPNSAILSLLLGGVHQPLVSSENTIFKSLNCASTGTGVSGLQPLPEQISLIEHLSISHFDGQPFSDVNYGILAKLAVDYALKQRQKMMNYYGNSFSWNMNQLASTGNLLVYFLW